MCVCVVVYTVRGLVREDLHQIQESQTRFFFPSSWTSLNTFFKENQISDSLLSLPLPPLPRCALRSNSQPTSCSFCRNIIIHSLVFTISAAIKKSRRRAFLQFIYFFSATTTKRKLFRMCVVCLFSPSSHYYFHAVSSTHTPQLQLTKEKLSGKNFLMMSWSPFVSTIHECPKSFLFFFFLLNFKLRGSITPPTFLLYTFIFSLSDDDDFIIMSSFYDHGGCVTHSKCWG